MSNQKPKVEAFFNEGEFLKDSSPESEKNKKIEKKEETLENIDNLAFDKKLWNLGEIQQFPDLSLKKESESKYSIDNPDILNQRLKEYLNEDLLNAIDSSPMITPKNIIKDATDENNPNNNEIDNDENIIEISDEDNKDLFQFSLYNNQDDKENNEKNDNTNETNELSNIKLDEINKIKEDEGGGNLNNLNIINNINEIKEENQIIENQININNIKNEDEKKEEELQKINEQEIKNESNIEEKNDNNKEKQETNKKNFYQPPQYQYQYPFIQFPYVTKPIIKTTNLFGHENKFDGNKKYQVIVPFVLKKNVKTKKPFEIREGDWTCSNCNNLNFSFRAKCNRCDLPKEESEKNKSKENKEQKFPQTKNKNYYPNMNMIQYKYYPGYIYVPIQGQFNKKEKK